MADDVAPHPNHGSGAAPHPGAVAITALAEALQLGPRELVSLVGGGGKTTALFALGRQLPPPVILTTTTKMGRGRTGGFPVLWSPTDEALSTALAPPPVPPPSRPAPPPVPAPSPASRPAPASASRPAPAPASRPAPAPDPPPDRAVLVWRTADERKAGGVGPERCDRWFAELGSVVVEADGSRRRPFKAPRPYEPVIPTATTMLVACVGADALGRVIADQCQRPLRVAAVAGCSPYQRLTPDRLAAVLVSDRGSAKDRPPGARFAVLVNQVTSAHTGYLSELAEHLAARSPSTPLVTVAPYTPDQSPEGP